MIRLESIRKEYDDVVAVKNLSLEINRGDIFGFIGPNGAGKTTTMRVMVGLLEPTQGQVYVDGQPINKDDPAFRRRIGYMPDFFSLYDELRVWEYLDFFGEAYGISDRPRRIDEVINLMDLSGKRNEFIANLSRGMKQRLGIGKTLLHDPDILVLDEPAAGLDPAARIGLRDVVRKLAAQGKTTIISSHILTELSDMCNTIGIIQKGVMVESGKIDDIVSRIQAKKILRLDMIGNREQAAEFVKTCSGVDFVTVKDNVIEIGFSGKREDIPELHKRLIVNNVQVVSFYEHRQNLEEIFMSLSVKEVS